MKHPALNKVAGSLPGLLYQLVRDKDGRLSLPYTNPFIRSFTSVSAEELSRDATPVFQGIHEEDRQHMIDSIEKSARELSVWQLDFRATTPDGNVIWIRGISVPERQIDGGTIWNGLMIDVTDEHATKESLEKSAADQNRVLSASETRRQTILDTVIDGIITLDEKGIIESINKAGQFYFGYEEQELIGKNISVLMPKSYAANHDQHISSYLETGHRKILDQGREVEGLRRDGSHFPLDLAVSEMHIDGKKMFTGVVRDITRRVAAEMELKKNEERLRLSQQFSNIITWEWDIKTNDLFWSHRLDGENRDVTGGIALKFSNFVDNIHPEDRDKVAEAIRLCLEERVDYQVEHRTLSKNGRVAWVLERGDVVRDAEGEPLRMIGIAQDITARKEAEQKLSDSERRLTEAHKIAKVGHWSYNLLDDTLYWSDEIYDMFGLGHDGVAPTPKMFFDVVHSEDIPKTRGLLDPDLADQLEFQNIDHRLVLRENEIFWVHLESKAHKDADNRITHLTGIIQDITERKQAELETLVAKEEAESAREVADKASQAKSEFLSHMSHELRTPMNAILGFTQILELEKDLTASQIEAVSEIHNAADHLLDLINDVLNLSRIESGKMILSIEPVSLQEVFNDCKSLMSPLAKESGIDMCWPDQDEIQQYIYVDRIRIKEVMLNLLSNAIKYNRAGGEVRISTQQFSKEVVRIRVSDTGIGISECQKENLFKSFNRLGAEASGVEGTGIGLVITKHLIELMGGNIGYESKDSGSTFWVDSPLIHTHDFSASNKDRDGGDIKALDQGSTCMDVLYVEDNPSNLRLIQLIMSRRPYINLISTLDGEIGLELAVIKRPDLILLDINLPGMDGYDLIDKLKTMKETRDIPVIAISAHAMPESIEKALSKGFEEYLTKPINVKHFLSIIDKKAEEIGRHIPVYLP